MTSLEPRALKVIGCIFLCLFAGECIFTSINLCSGRNASSDEDWHEFILLMLGVVTTLVTLSRDLPWQNVIGAFVIIGTIASGMEVSIFVLLGLKPAFGLFWPVPLVWVIAILNAQGVARLVLHRWQSSSTYGFGLFGLTVFLATLFGFSWYSLNKAYPYLLAALPISMAALLAASPWLINKRPGKRVTRWEPLITWLSINLLFVTAAFCQRALFATAFLLLSNLSIFSLAIANRIYQRTKS